MSLILGGADKDGWQYAKDFPASYHPEPSFTDYVRRRRWARRCCLVTSGPWSAVGNTKLLDISLAPFSSESREVEVWGVATNGEALYRLGVSREQPAGEAWCHVRSDVLYQSVSIGCDGSVWLVSSEGHVTWRQGVSRQCPSGQCWVQLASPGSVRFRSVECGRSGLWAVDTDNKLWLRQGVSAQYPEGVSWSAVCDSVRSVSSGDNGELWGVLDMGGGGVVARRAGVTPSQPGGSDWEIGVGAGWKHVTTRAWVK